MIKLGMWPQSFDENDLRMRVTLTRFSDPANNSDKFRRFFTLYLPGSVSTHRPWWFTQTGRWTVQTQSGVWTGGTVRDGQFHTGRAMSRARQDPMQVHDDMVAQRRKNYTVQGSPATYNWNAIQPLVGRIPGLNGQITHLNGATATPQPVRVSPALTEPLTTKAAAPPRTDSGNIDVRMNNLLARVQHDGIDVFDLLEEFAMLKPDVVKQVEYFEWQALELKQQMELLNEQIMRRL